MSDKDQTEQELVENIPDVAEGTPAKKEGDQLEYVTPTTNPNVTQEFAHSKPLPPTPVVDWTALTESLTFLGGNVRDLNALIANHPNINASADPKSREWLKVISEAQASFVQGDAFAGSLERKDSDWGQYVDSEGEKLAPSRPRFGDGGTVLTGERAILRVAAATGLGSIVQVPLWHTGIWVSFKAPPESAILELERRITSDKVTLGRHTNGLVFSNSSVYMTENLVNFALTYIFDTNAKELGVEYLKSIIKVTDIPILLWGMAMAIYPNGYPYAQSCANVEGTCHNVIKEQLDLGKLMWTDRSSLTPWQRKRMSQRKARMSDEDLLRYQNEHRVGGDRTIKASDVISFKLNVPTLEAYELAGYGWVDGIIQMMDEAFKTPLRGDERDTYISNQGRLTNMRQYSHWISEVLVPDSEIGNDRETIDGLMNLFSANEEIRTNFISEISKYINDSTLSLIGLPKHNCPSCNYPQGNVEEASHPFVIPLDVGHLFFTLLNQRINKVLIKSYL